MYEKLKKQNGEKFAQTLRNFHNGLLGIPDLDVILRHAGGDAEPLLPYLMSLLPSNDDIPVPLTAADDPFVLLDQAGYDAFYADTLKKQNSIKHYFAPRELLCTFNDSTRFQEYHIIHAVKKDVEQINRKAFIGKERREDEYGTSVISIQMLKNGGFISIKNRYNHAVNQCDNTFNSNPDNIIDGLSAALKDRFSVEFTAQRSALPEGFVLMGNRIFQYHRESNNTYFGHDAWAKNGVVHEADKSLGNALFEGYLYENKTKTLKLIGGDSSDTFADDFNLSYGGNKALCVQNGNLTLNGEILIGAEQSRIKTLDLPALVTMGNSSLVSVRSLTSFKAHSLTTMGRSCLYFANALEHFEAPALITMGKGCFHSAPNLTHFKAPALIEMGEGSLFVASALKHFEAPALTTMANSCLFDSEALTKFEAPSLGIIGSGCLVKAFSLMHFNAPALKTMGEFCLNQARSLVRFEAEALTIMHRGCLSYTINLKHFEAPSLTRMGHGCLSRVHATCQKPSYLKMLSRQFLQASKTLLGLNRLQSANTRHFEP